MMNTRSVAPDQQEVPTEISPDGTNLSIADVVAVAREKVPVRLKEELLHALTQAHQRVQTWGSASIPIYGVTTAFGEMTYMAIPPQHGTLLQENLIRSHAAGGGAIFPPEVVRAMLLLRLNCFLKGVSGVGPTLVQLLVELLNRDIIPVVPQQGSLGASGDLAPLAHLALPLLGEGFVFFQNQKLPTAQVFEQEGLQRLQPGFKEGLALINGTSAMTAVACLALADAQHLLNIAFLLSADYVQALRGSLRAFDPSGHALKNHNGQVRVAALLERLLQDSHLAADHSDLMASMQEQAHRHEGSVVDTGIYIQHAYTLRCVPQILGPVAETLEFSTRIVTEEINSANDNPLVFDEPEATFHGGNFHGQYVAMACDFANIALTEIGVLAERQLNRLIDPYLNGSLPPFLTAGEAGLFMGMQGAQYLATSIASENLDLAAPASIKSIPSNGSNQDVVSMGLIAARKSRTLCQNVQQILGVLAAGCQQAAYFIGFEHYSPQLAAWHALLAERGQIYRDEQAAADFIQPIVTFLSSAECIKWVTEMLAMATAREEGYEHLL